MHTTNAKYLLFVKKECQSEADLVKHSRSHYSKNTQLTVAQLFETRSEIRGAGFVHSTRSRSYHGFVRDITIADGTVVLHGASMTTRSLFTNEDWKPWDLVPSGCLPLERIHSINMIKNGCLLYIAFKDVSHLYIHLLAQHSLFVQQY